MAAYNGPYEPLPEFYDGTPIEIFPNGDGTCPSLKGLIGPEGTKTYAGPAYVPWILEAAQWSWGCSNPVSPPYILHSVRVKTTYQYNRTSVGHPGNSYFQTTGISVRIAITSEYPQPTVYGNNINPWLNAVKYFNVVNLGWDDYWQDYIYQWDRASSDTQYLFVRADFSSYQCPKGTTYNSVTGMCEVNDGYIWDGEAYVADYCVSIESTGDVYDGDTAHFKLTLIPDEPADDDLEVFISYFGSTATEGTVFDGPSKVIIPKGETEAYFNVNTFVGSFYEEHLTINASISVDQNNPLDAEICEGFSSILVHNKEWGNKLTDSTCCNYFQSQYQEWQSCMRIPTPKYPGNAVKE